MKLSKKFGILTLLLCTGGSFAAAFNANWAFPVGLRNVTLPLNVPMPHSLNASATSGGPATGCSSTPTLPAGLVVNLSGSTCKISGTPTAGAPQTVYTITATTSAASSTTPETLTVTPVMNLAYTQSFATYAVGTAIDSNLATVVGSAPDGYAVTSGTLPAGLSLNSTTGIITGTPTAVTAASNVTITATNGAFTSSVTLNIAVQAAVDYGSFNMYKGITYTPSGMARSIGNYPLLVKLDSSNFDFTKSMSDISTVPAGTNYTGPGGADVRFTRADGKTDLPFQIERWDGLNRRAEIWVLIPVISMNTPTIIRVYFGKTGQTTTSSDTAVFSTANKFQAVWHMNQGGTGNEADATQNAYTGTAVGTTPPATSTGLIGLGRNFTGGTASQAFTTTATSVTGFVNNGFYTLSAWVNATTINTGTYYTIIQKHDRQFALQVNNSNPNKWESAEYNADSGGTAGATAYGWMGTGTGASTNATTGVHYVVGQHDGFYQRIYLDGSLLQTNNATGGTGNAVVSSSTTAPTLTNAVTIGRQSESATGRPWLGNLDEIRMHSTVRDSNWIKADYQTQLPTGTAVAYGANVVLTVIPVISVNPAAQTVQLPANTAKFFVVATGTGPFTYNWIRTRTAGTDTLANTGIFTGTATDTLRLTGVTLSDSGSTFKCMVSNAAGPAVSASASLTVLSVVVGISPSYVVHVKGLSPFSFRIPEGVNAVRMTVENMKGQAVWNRELTPTRERTVSWNGSGTDGHAVSPGMYVVRLKFIASGR